MVTAIQRPSDSGDPTWADVQPVRLPVKVLVYSPVIPPHDSGQALVIYRLFERVHQRDYCLASFNNGPPPPPGSFNLPQLPGRTYRLTGRWSGTHPGFDYKLQPIRDLRHIGQEAGRRAAALAGIVRNEECRAILAASGMLPDLPAALIASRLTGAALYVQMFDHWRYKETVPTFRKMAGVLERLVLAGATGVIVPNETLGEELTRLYGTKWILVRNPSEDAAIFPSVTREILEASVGGKFRIVYTGQVYEAHFDAFRHLMTALEASDLQDVEVHVYTSQTTDDLARGGIKGRVVIHPHVPPPAIYEIQRSADILFLPLAFESPYPEIIRTSATTKLGDYLASGRPVLVHAPAGAFPCRFIAFNDCGVVVDEPAPDQLATAIRRIRDDADLRRRIGVNARAVAPEFSIQVARSALIAALEPLSPR